MRSAIFPPLLLIALLSGAASPAADLREMRARGSLRVLVVHGELFWSLTPGTAPGFDREVMEGFARLHRLTLEEVRPPGWPSMVPWLLEGKGDLIVGGYADSEERRQRLAFTVEIFPSRDVVLTRKPHRVVRTVEELREETVGVIRNTSMAGALAAAGVPATKTVFVRSGTLPEVLKQGRVGAVVLPVEHAMYARRDDPALQLGLFLGNRVRLAYALRKEDVELRSALDEYIGNLRRTPRWNQLVVKYLGDDALDVLRAARGE